jgi:hypothetical protein
MVIVMFSDQLAGLQTAEQQNRTERLKSTAMAMMAWFGGQRYL